MKNAWLYLWNYYGNTREEKVTRPPQVCLSVSRARAL